MLRYLLPIFILIPLLEAWLLINVGQVIGAASTIGLIVLTAALGVFWLRKQGISTLARIQNSMAAGKMPATELVEGALLLIAGALLLTPGFATDAIGFLLLWPITRRFGVQWLLKHAVGRAYSYSSFQSSMQTENLKSSVTPPQDSAIHQQHFERRDAKQRSGSKEHTGDIIDAEYTRED